MIEHERPDARWRYRLALGEYDLRYSSQIPDSEVPRFRQVHAGLFHDGDYVGYFKIGAYRPRPEFCADELLNDLDAISTDSTEFATVLTNSWSELDLRRLADDGGSFLHFAWVWIREDHRPRSTWVTAFEALISAQFPRYAVMPIQASPFEMMHADPPAEQTAITARQEMMIRGYERLLGVKRIPGYWGECSWQLNREATKKKKNEEVGLSEIGYSDAIGQISSVVLGLFQEESIETVEGRQVHVMKGRNGEVGNFSTRWNFHVCDFTEIDGKTVEEADFYA
jgi:hypothetical protein